MWTGWREAMGCGAAGGWRRGGEVRGWTHPATPVPLGPASLCPAVPLPCGPVALAYSGSPARRLPRRAWPLPWRPNGAAGRVGRGKRARAGRRMQTPRPTPAESGDADSHPDSRCDSVIALNVRTKPVAVGAHHVALSCFPGNAARALTAPNHRSDVASLFSANVVEIHAHGMKALAAVEAGSVF